MGARDFIDDVLQDDGFIPLTPWGRAEMMRDYGHKIIDTNGNYKVAAGMLAIDRFKEKPVLVDIPGTDWDEENLGTKEVFKEGASLISNLLTEAFASIGGLIASLANMTPSIIDDMAHPAIELGDLEGVFYRNNRSNNGFGFLALSDIQELFPTIPSAYSVLDTTNKVFSLSGSAYLSFPDVDEENTGDLFCWDQYNPRTGKWVASQPESESLWDDATSEWVTPASIGL